MRVISGSKRVDSDFRAANISPATAATACAAPNNPASFFAPFSAAEQAWQTPLHALPQKRALVHGHCHQKAFDALNPAVAVLKLVPGLQVDVIESSCCGMAGSFGYEAAHYDVSMKMAELSLLPAVRAAGDDTLIVADGTSCRHQIADGASREAIHVVRVQ